MNSVIFQPERWCDRERFPFTILFVAIVGSACLMPAQSDTWWHLRTGEEIWRSGRVLLYDQFTHTVPGRAWPDHEWLTQVIFYALYVAGGLPLITLLCAAAVAVAWIIVLSLTPGPAIFRVALVGCGAALSSGAWSLRPQVLTMMMFAVTLWVLVRRRYVWALPPLFLLWANLHGGVVLGGVLIAAAALASLRAGDGWFTRLTVVGGLCFIATTLTPLGLSLWFELPQMVRRNEVYGVQEFQPTGLSTWSDAAFWLTAGSMIALAVVRRRVLQSVHPLTLVISATLLFVMAIRNARQVTPFFLCVVPTIAVLLSVRATRKEHSPVHGPMLRNAVTAATCGLAAACFIAYAWSVSLPRLAWEPLPPGVIAAIDDCPGPLYNRYDDGGALLWFAKDRKIFIDSRQDPFPMDLVFEHIEVERTGDYRRMFDRYGIACALTHRGLPLAARLQRDGWTERRAGGHWTVYRRPLRQFALSAEPQL